MAFALPDLPYDYSALEPHIDTRTMKIHHSKHHQGYVNKLNVALDKHTDLSNKSIETLLQDLNTLPGEIRLAVRNNGGGHYNHSLFWQVMSKDGGGEPAGKLVEAIKRDFGNTANLREEFTKTATGRFGSGWAWLVVDSGKLSIVSTPNQDNPILASKIAILGLDVWEHAYYLKYQNRRADYIQAWWNVVNWQQVNQNYQQAIANN